MTLRDNQRVTGGHRVTVVESDARGRLANDFNPARQFTERAGFALLARQLIEVIVLIEFVTLVGDEALVRQLDIALISILLVYGMEPEALFG